MGKVLRIILYIFLVIVSIETVVLLLSNAFRFRYCPTIANYPDENGIRCSRPDGAYPLSGASFVLPVESVTQEADQVYLTLRYPLFGGLISLPLRFRSGMIMEYASVKDTPRVNLCKLYGDCQNLSPNELYSYLKPGVLIAPKVYTALFFSPKDPYSVLCQNVQKDFVTKALFHQSLFSFFNLLKKRTCAPIVGQIFYK